MEEDRRRDRGGEVYRPANQEEGGSNSDAASPTNGGLPLRSSPLLLLRSALGRIVLRRHGGGPGGVPINPPSRGGWGGWGGGVEKKRNSPAARTRGAKHWRV